MIFLVENRNLFFDNVKGVLIFTVVFGHALKPLIVTSNFATFIYAFIYIFHMPFFVFISGYFSKKKNNKKLINLIYIYLVWQMIICPIILYLTTKNFSKSFQLPINPQWTYWYLFALIFWRFITPIVNEFVKLKKMLIFSIFLSILIGFLDLPW